jgi:virginiamycin A acetyltransferase
MTELPAHYTLYLRLVPSEIGFPVYIGEFSHIAQGTHIGKFCSIANLVTIGAQPHAMDRISSYAFEAPVVRETHIEHDVWIGAGSVVMAGVRIGTGAVIGAGSMVTRDIPPYAVAYGNPARVRRYRFEPEVVERLLASKWWDLPPQRVWDLSRLDIDSALKACAV